MNLYKTFLASALMTVSAQAADFYVSPQGVDSNNGSISAPFKSIEQARNAIRNLKNSGRKENNNVYLRAGTHQRSQTLVLGLKDSAPEGFKNTLYLIYKENI